VTCHYCDGDAFGDEADQAQHRGVPVETLRHRLERATARPAEALATGILTSAVCTETAATLARQAEHSAKIRAAKSPSSEPDADSTFVDEVYLAALGRDILTETRLIFD